MKPRAAILIALGVSVLMSCTGGGKSAVSDELLWKAFMAVPSSDLDGKLADPAFRATLKDVPFKVDVIGDEEPLPDNSLARLSEEPWSACTLFAYPYTGGKKLLVFLVNGYCGNFFSTGDNVRFYDFDINSDVLSPVSAPAFLSETTAGGDSFYYTVKEDRITRSDGYDRLFESFFWNGNGFTKEPDHLANIFLNLPDSCFPAEYGCLLPKQKREDLLKNHEYEEGGNEDSQNASLYRSFDRLGVYVNMDPVSLFGSLAYYPYSDGKRLLVLWTGNQGVGDAYTKVVLKAFDYDKGSGNFSETELKMDPWSKKDFDEPLLAYPHAAVKVVNAYGEKSEYFLDGSIDVTFHPSPDGFFLYPSKGEFNWMYCSMALELNYKWNGERFVKVPADLGLGTIYGPMGVAEFLVGNEMPEAWQLPGYQYVQSSVTRFGQMASAYDICKDGKTFIRLIPFPYSNDGEKQKIMEIEVYSPMFRTPTGFGVGSSTSDIWADGANVFGYDDGELFKEVVKMEDGTTAIHVTYPSGSYEAFFCTENPDAISKDARVSKLVFRPIAVG